MRLIVQPVALRALAALPADERAALWRKAQEFAANPFTPRVWAKPLKGERHAVRLRQGDWRAVCRIDRPSDTVVIVEVGHRREIYR